MVENEIKIIEALKKTEEGFLPLHVSHNMIKKTIKLIIIILIIVFSIKIIKDLSFTGTKEALIIDNYNKISSLNELINLPQFDNKVLYINLYNVYCSSSINEFKYLHRMIDLSKKMDITFIHIATPKMTFTNNWKSTVKEYNLKGHHMLMNQEFYKEFWSHFPNKFGKYTPFYVAVSKDKIISQISSPSIIEEELILKECGFIIAKYVKTNLDSIRENLLENIDKLRISIDFNINSSIDGVSYFSNSEIENFNNKNRTQVWNNLDVKIKKTFDSISDKINFKNYTFNLPLNPIILDSILMEREKISN